MYSLIQFIRSISLLLLFLFLEGVAILFYAHSNSYTQAKILGYSAGVSGIVGEVTSGISGYFSLRGDNRILLNRIILLEKQVDHLTKMHSDSTLLAHSLIDESGVSYLAANVVRNTTNRSKNYMLINRGLRSGVRERMAVVTPSGDIVGSVVGCNEGYSVVMSLLNSDFFTSGRLEVSEHVGGVSWDGRDRHIIQLTDLSKYAEPFEGAEIVTTGLSKIFPRGFKIGRVIDYQRSKIDGSYSVNIEIAADMSALREVVVINSVEIGEASAVMDHFEQRGRVMVEIESEEGIEEVKWCSPEEVNQNLKLSYPTIRIVFEEAKKL